MLCKKPIYNDKSVASCQQTCFMLFVKTCYSQACCKLFQQVVTSLQMTSCNEPDFNRIVAMDRLHYGQSFEKRSNGKIHYNSIEEHPKISKLAKFGRETL